MRRTTTEPQCLCLGSWTHPWTTLPPTPLTRQPGETGSLCLLAWVRDSCKIRGGEGGQSSWDKGCPWPFYRSLFLPVPETAGLFPFHCCPLLFPPGRASLCPVRWWAEQTRSRPHSCPSGEHRALARRPESSHSEWEMETLEGIRIYPGPCRREERA